MNLLILIDGHARQLREDVGDGCLGTGGKVADVIGIDPILGRTGVRDVGAGQTLGFDGQDGQRIARQRQQRCRFLGGCMTTGEDQQEAERSCRRAHGDKL